MPGANCTNYPVQWGGQVETEQKKSLNSEENNGGWGFRGILWLSPCPYLYAGLEISVSALKSTWKFRECGKG